MTYNVVLYISNSADKVVQGSGKFEELVVASHDIAASTAQLVSIIIVIVLGYEFCDEC